MPSVSQAQKNLMAAASHDSAFAKKVGIKPSVAKEFNQADAKHPDKILPKKKEGKATSQLPRTVSEVSFIKMNHWFGNGGVKSPLRNSKSDEEKHDVDKWFIIVFIGCLFVSSL